MLRGQLSCENRGVAQEPIHLPKYTIIAYPVVEVRLYSPCTRTLQQAPTNLDKNIWFVARKAMHLSRYAPIETVFNGELRNCCTKSHRFIETYADPSVEV